PWSSGMQHTMSPPTGGAPTHGFGRHEVALATVPPRAAHSSGVRSSHSGPSSSGTQQTTFPGAPGGVTGKSATRTSLPSASRTTMDLPRGSNPRERSLPRGRDRKRIFPPPPPLVTRSPTCTPSTITSNVALGASLRTWISNCPTLACLSASEALPLAFASTPVVTSTSLTFFPLAETGVYAAVTRIDASNTMRIFFIVTSFDLPNQQPACRRRSPCSRGHIPSGGGEAAPGGARSPASARLTACRRGGGSIDVSGMATVVIIEDEAVLARNLGKAFARRGFVVREAGTIAEGLRAVEEARPEVVLLDLRLP